MPDPPQDLSIVSSPPLADRPPVRPDDDAAARLRRLTDDPSTFRDRRHLIEYLRLRRALR